MSCRSRVTRARRQLQLWARAKLALAAQCALKKAQGQVAASGGSATFHIVAPCALKKPAQIYEDPLLACVPLRRHRGLWPAAAARHFILSHRLCGAPPALRCNSAVAIYVLCPPVAQFARAAPRNGVTLPVYLPPSHLPDFARVCPYLLWPSRVSVLVVRSVPFGRPFWVLGPPLVPLGPLRARLVARRRRFQKT